MATTPDNNATVESVVNTIIDGTDRAVIPMALQLTVLPKTDAPTCAACHKPGTKGVSVRVAIGAVPPFECCRPCFILLAMFAADVLSVTPESFG